MLTINNLSLSFFGSKQLLDNVSFTVGKNEVFALVGESGSGKTLTAQSVLKLLPSAQYTPQSQILWQGKNLLTLPDKELQQIRGKEISYIFQEPSLALNPTHTIGKQIAEVFLLHQDISKRDAYQEARRILNDVGYVDAPLEAYPYQLSGGQKQRVIIAIALALKPDLIVADEPTTSLDRNAQQSIIDLLAQYKDQCAFLLITHDMSVVKQIADRIGIIHEGRMLEVGTTDEIMQNPQHSYTKKLIEAHPKGKAIALPAHAPVALEAQGLSKDYTTKQLLWYREEKRVLDDVTFTVTQGSALGIIGESGSGKTTITKILVGLEKASAGRVLYCPCDDDVIPAKAGIQSPINHDITNLSLKAWRPYRAKIQLIFQDPFGSLNPKMTVGEIIQEGLRIHKPDAKADIVMHMLHAVGLDETALHRYPHAFSGGQRQRIALARALVLEPDILILDEPTSSLDRTIQSEILTMLKKLQKEKGLTYIFISHDLKVVQSLCHYIIVLKDGRMVESGTTKNIFTHPQHAYTKTLVETAF